MRHLQARTASIPAKTTPALWCELPTVSRCKAGNTLLKPRNALIFISNYGPHPPAPAFWNKDEIASNVLKNQDVIIPTLCAWYLYSQHKNDVFDKSLSALICFCFLITLWECWGVLFFFLFGVQKGRRFRFIDPFYPWFIVVPRE